MPARQPPREPTTLDLYWGRANLGVTFFEYSHGTQITILADGQAVKSYFGALYDPAGQPRRMSDDQLAAWLEVAKELVTRREGGGA